MPTITFDGIPTQFGPVFSFPSGVQVGYRGLQYVEDGFIITHVVLGPPPPFIDPNYKPTLDSPLVADKNYFLTGEDIAFLDVSPLKLARVDGNDTFGIKSIKLDGVFGLEAITFTAVDASGGTHTQTVFTDNAPGLVTF